jgi:hypothetical protein
MGFSITDGAPGILGASFIVLLVAAGLIAAYFFFATAREAHDDVVDGADGDQEA